MTHRPPLTHAYANATNQQLSAGTAILFSMFSTSYMAHTNAVKFYNELKDRSVPRFAQVVGVAMGAATFIYLAVMTLGFETFGLNAQVRGSVRSMHGLGSRDDASCRYLMFDPLATLIHPPIHTQGLVLNNYHVSRDVLATFGKHISRSP